MEDASLDTTGQKVDSPKLTSKQWDDWVSLHCRLVCVPHPAYKAMLAEWRKRLELYDASDLEAASRWFVENWFPNHPESQWGSHPGVIKKKLGEMFAERSKREQLKESLADKRPLTFAGEGNRAKVLDVSRGIGKPGEAKEKA